MAFQYCISKLRFSDTSNVDLIEGDITLIIGPNNCGKSEALRNIWECISIQEGQQTSTKVVKSAKVMISVGPEAISEIVATLEENPSNPAQVGRMGNNVSRADLLQLNANADWLRRALQQFLVRLLGAAERLTITLPPQSIDLTSQIKSHPIHYLYANEDLEESFSSDFRKAFGTDLVVNHFAGQTVPLHVGDSPDVPPNGDRLSQPYRIAISKLPLLHQQGDGMRSFVGTLLWARVSDFRVLLIDEPEAFLHPPQARLLARLLAKGKKATTQIIAATHSGDFLRGILDSNIQNLRIVRLTRKDQINPTTELTPDQLKVLWADPLIRQSNLLDALFHEQCVVCESEGDCQFYGGILNALSDLKPDQVGPDTMFASVGGKNRVAKAAAALARLNVRVKVVLDFDALRDEQPLRTIFENLGGTLGEHPSALESSPRRRIWEESAIRCYGN
jgi:energy-coupling factor transporter ATP-binding protein EcfA2